MADIINSNLSQEEKEIIVLHKNNSSERFPFIINFPFHKSITIDIDKIRAYRNKRIEEKIKEINDENLTEEEKELRVLEEMNTKIDSNDEEEENNTIFLSFSELSTMSTSFPTISEEKKNYWINCKLYDVKIKNKNFDYPILYVLDKETNKYCYLYKNELVTYNFVKSVIFGDNYTINDELLKDKNYHESFGLCFCQSNIILNEKEIQKCCPNEMVCKDCMEKNKNMYNLKNKYLININGRAARKHKRRFHCFGHFLIGNQIENCVDKFSCEACKLLDKFENYYFC